MNTVDLQRYLHVLFKWSWLLILAGGLAAGVSYYSLRKVPRTYVSSTTIMVGDAINDPNPSGGLFSTAQELAGAYADMVQQEPILSATIKALKLPMSWQQLQGQVLVVHNYGADTFEIRVVDIDPRRAQVIAAGLAQQVILASPTEKNRQELESRRAFIQQQLDDLQSKIQAAQQERAQKQADLARETTARGVLDQQDAIKALDLNIADWQKTYSSLLSSEQGGSSPNTLTIVEPATLPLAPAGPQKTTNVALAGLAGMLLAAAVALSMEFLDNTVKSKEELETLVNAPVLGLIASSKLLRQPRSQPVLVAEPDSLVAETFRSLAVNLRYASLSQSSVAVLVTSPSPSEGKSTIAANLATALAQGGKRVLLVDLDLREPTLHKFFGVPNQLGLTTLLLNAEAEPSQYVVDTPIANLRLLPSGQIPKGVAPGDLIPADALNRFGEQLIRTLRSAVDFLVIDAPPILAATDALILAGLVDGTVLVTKAASTRRGAARSARIALDRTSARLFGTVLNQAHENDTGLAAYHYYRRRGRSLGRFFRLSRREAPSSGA